jgi:rfaE bifunctional protein nucleotidyltransferase chain/domain
MQRAYSSRVSLDRIELSASNQLTSGQVKQVGQIVSSERLIELRREWQREGKRVVAAAGAFDLLHPGHVRLLEQARDLGDMVVVAVENDDCVRAAAKADGEPVTPQAERAEILAALAAVDFVTELHDLSVTNWIDRFQPHIYVHGGTAAAPRSASALYESKDAARVQIVSIPLEPGYSGTLLIERIQHSPQ